MVKSENKIPQLRFPEFEGDWCAKNLGLLFTNSRAKGNNSTTIYSVSQKRGLVPRESLDRSIEKDAAPEENLSVLPGDLVYNMMRMWQGAIGLAYTECMVSPAYIVLRPNIEVNSSFFIKLFDRKRSLYLFKAYSYGLTLDRLRLYYKDFADIKMNCPEVKEQAKIASFLTAVDQKLALLEKKKGLLEQYKKGVMQKVFSQEIRFKPTLSEVEGAENGNNYPVWEVKKLGELCNLSKGEQLNKTSLALHGSYPTINGGVKPSGYSEKWNTPANTITISEGGNSCGYVNLIKTKFWCGGHCYAIDNIHDKIEVSYLYQILKYNENLIMRLRVGSGLPNIQKKDINQFKIIIPCRLEQIQISSFLKGIDLKIEKVEIELAKTREWKQGLLQGMFV